MKTEGGSLNEITSHRYISCESILVPAKRHLALFAIIFRNSRLLPLLYLLLSGFHIVTSRLFTGTVFSIRCAEV
jgi:hypothetical protein